jgi:hypothetical protein
VQDNIQTGAGYERRISDCRRVESLKCFEGRSVNGASSRWIAATPKHRSFFCPPALLPSGSQRDVNCAAAECRNPAAGILIEKGSAKWYKYFSRSAADPSPKDPSGQLFKTNESILNSY